MSRYEDLSDEGEVDHTFFDSDVDEVGKTVQSNVSETVKRKGVQAEDDKPENRPKFKVELRSHNSSSSEEDKEIWDQPQTLNLQNRPSMGNTAASSLPRPGSAHSSGRNSAQSLKITATIPTGIPKIRCEYEDNYYTDEEDSSDEGKAQRCRPKSAKQPGSFKKNAVRKTMHVNSSSSSSEAEGSDSGSSKPQPPYSKTKSNASAAGSTSSSREHSPTSVTKASDGTEKHHDYHDESEDTVTDVTPLSTPDISPIQSFDLVATNEMKKKNMELQENLSQEIYDPDMEQKCNQKALHDAMDLNQLLKAFMHLDKKEQKNLVIDHPAIARPKNYSFTNEEVRHIDRENQRLLKELSRQATKPRSKMISPQQPAGPPPKLYHTTINRQREQLRIERDNLALLKRLESIKPTVGLKRSEQLMDYQRQVGYLNPTATSPRPVKSSTSRHSSSHGHSRASSAGTRSERSISSTSSAALLRPSKSTSVRAAWLLFKSLQCWHSK